jgi:hypothetical protein
MRYKRAYYRSETGGLIITRHFEDRVSHKSYSLDERQTRRFLDAVRNHVPLIYEAAPFVVYDSREMCLVNLWP